MDEQTNAHHVAGPKVGNWAEWERGQRLETMVSKTESLEQYSETHFG